MADAVASACDRLLIDFVQCMKVLDHVVSVLLAMIMLRTTSYWLMLKWTRLARTDLADVCVRLADVVLVWNAVHTCRD